MLLRATLAITLAIWGASAGYAADVFQAGAFAIDVTPLKFPISVNGGMADRQATMANDPLHARCLALDDGKNRLAIVVVDSCMIPRDLMETAKLAAAKKTGIPADHILIAATHTHSAPTVAGVFQSDPDSAYAAFLAEKIAEGIEKADRKRVPAQIGWASAENREQLFNRRWKREHALIPADPFGRTADQVQMNPGYQAKGLTEPAGGVDPELFVVAVRTPEGKPLALLANYSLHYVGGNPQLSGDYFAAFADRMARLLDPESGSGSFVAIMSNGTSADVNNVNFASPAPKAKRSGEQIRVVADSVARTALEAYKKIDWRNHVALRAAVKEIALGVRKPSADDLAYGKQKIAEEPDPKNLKNRAAIYGRESLLLRDYPDTVPVKLQTLAIGELGIAAIPCEVFTEIGLEIKKKSPLKRAFTIELANGYNGYLPTPEQHRLGGYETWRARSSYLEIEASPTIVSTILELFTKVAE
jgi:hypothetical protein